MPAIFAVKIYRLPKIVKERDEEHMSIYQNVLGSNFKKLHPMLQQRYIFLGNQPFLAVGKMKKIQVGPNFLYPILWLGTKCKLLFPEQGTNIPFTIRNTPIVGPNGEEQIHWERIFIFKDKKRYFNALMSLSPDEPIIKDYLGEPSFLYSDLIFNVTSDGSLKIESGKQRLVIGPFEIPLPKCFQGIATVTESYNDKRNVFHIAVQVRNPIVGLIFAYEGEFIANEME